MHLLLCILAFACLTSVAHSACVNGYYNGLQCASTSRYTVDSQGSCGCGNDQTNKPFSWQQTKYTAAGSAGFFNPSNPSSGWCGSGCGACYNITPTGDCPTGGNCVRTYQSIVVMITNYCPPTGNEVWCPLPNTNNNYGYKWHFDLNSQAISSLGWDNPAVTFQQVPCDGNTNTPTCAEGATCHQQCTPAINRNCVAGQSPTSSSASSSSSSSSSTSSRTTATSSRTTATSSSSTASSPTASTKSSTATSQSGASTSQSGTSSPAPTTSTPCAAGTLRCACAAGTCNTGLSCISNVCVNPDDALRGFAASLSPSLFVFAVLLFGPFLF